MTKRFRSKNIWLGLACLLVIFSAACGNGTPLPTVVLTAQPVPPTSPMTEAPSATATPSEPTPTPVPLAALVNGEPLTLEDFQAELARFQAAQAALGREISPADAELVLEDMVARTLLAQAAAQAGFALDEATLQARLDALAQAAGGEAALLDWQTAHSYTPDDFRRAVAAEAAAAWMRDQVIASIPEKTEQVHALQILLYNSNETPQVLARIQAGTDFAVLAREYDPVLGGDLGWFPVGYLLEPAVEAAAFALQPGEVSPWVETERGFHLVQVIERDPERALDPAARGVLQRKALRDWLAVQRSQSEVQVFLPDESL